MPHQVHRSGNSAACRLASSQTDKVQYRNGQVITHAGLDEPARKGTRHLPGKRDACQSHLIPLPSTTETIQSKLAPCAETTIASLPPGCGRNFVEFRSTPRARDKILIMAVHTDIESPCKLRSSSWA